MQTFVEGREAVDVEKNLGNTLFDIFYPISRSFLIIS